MDLICSLHLQSLASLSVFHSGGRVVHSYGRLIPHEFPITNLQQMSGPDGIGRINCTVSSGRARFYRPVRIPVTNQDTLAMKRVTLVVNTNVANFRNRERYCKNAKTNYFYIFLSFKSKCNQIRMHSACNEWHCSTCLISSVSGINGYYYKSNSPL